MKRLGITGGMGSGKSYVSRVLSQHFGVPVYSCDERAKWLMQNSPELRQALTRLVGPRLYDEAGRFSKQAMAAYLFASKENAQAINGIVHPAVRTDFRQWCQLQTASVVAMESAILYESGFDSEVDEVLLVDAPQETRIRRAMQRDGATCEQVLQRISHQQTYLARERATYRLLNGDNETEETIIQQIKELKLC